MRRLALAAWLALAALVLLAVAGGRSALAQEKETDSILERIRAAQAQASGTDEGKGIDLTAPGEGARKETEKEQARRKELLKAAQLGMSPYDYARSTGVPLLPGQRDLLDRYDLRARRDELLDRLGAGGGPAAQKETQRGPGTITGGAPSPDWDYREATRPYAPAQIYQMYRSPLRGTTGIIAGEETLLAARPASDLPAGSPRSEINAPLPDPETDYDRYARRLTSEYGVRAALPEHTDPNLTRTYETQRFNRWLTNEQEVRVQRGSDLDLARLYSTYREFGQLPQISASLGRRDAYVPFSQDFVNPTYRGTIYSAPFSSDPYQRNYSLNTTQSKYSSQSFYDLQTNESLADYYNREYGVGRAFLPGSSSRHYDINTLKQWSASLQRDYGIDIRPGDKTYADLYRIYTSKPGY